MKKNLTKVGKLLVILTLPALIILGLHFFGDNKFDVPVYQPAGKRISECSVNLQIALSQIREGNNNVIVIILPTDEKTVQNTLALLTEHYGNRVEMIVVADKEYLALSEEDLSTVSVSKYEFNEISTCLFKEDQNALIVDKHDQVRGYYALGTRSEMDRLLTELELITEDERK